MTASALRLVELAGANRSVDGDGDEGWLEWLVGHVDPGWRRGEWDHALWLFTGDLDSDRTVGWACRTPSCRGLTRRHDARCDTCRHAQAAGGLADEAFDRQPCSVRPQVNQCARRGLSPPSLGRGRSLAGRQSQGHHLERAQLERQLPTVAHFQFGQRSLQQVGQGGSGQHERRL